MDPVQITPEAQKDIERLERGVDRIDVALEALRSSQQLSPAQVAQLKALLARVSPTEGAPSATTSAAGGRIETVDGHQAVVGEITFNGQQLDTLLSEGSFNKSRSDQIQYAEKLGYRMATQKENRAYVAGLLANADNNPINDAELKALWTYQTRYVRDTAGGLDVDGGRVRADVDYCWDNNAKPNRGALFVRASEESK